MKVLVACEFSGVVRRAFTNRGHYTVSCDLLPSDDDSAFHYQGDVMDIVHQDWDLMIAHPPCTYLCNSGVRWLTGKDADPARWGKMEEAATFFMFLWGQDHIPKICIENPIPHKHTGLPRYTQIIQPYQHGHPESKATCLWLKGLPDLEPTDVVDPPYEGKVHMMGETKDRWRKRSVTYTGIANAMAMGWG